MVDITKIDMTNIWASSGDKTAPDPSKIATGWVVEAVPRQWWNWFENRQDVNIAYMLQKGIPEWDISTEYLTNKSYVQRNNIVYKAILTGTNKDPATQPTYWVKAFPESSASLEAIRALTPAADRLPYFTSSSAAALATFTSFARTLLDDADAATMRTTLSAQLSHANLTALSGVTAANNTLPYFTGTTTMTGTSLTAFGRSILDDADATAGRATLGLGTVATYDITTSNLDAQPNRIVKVGDFGENGGVGIAQAASVDADFLTPGLYVFASGGLNLPTASAYYIKHIGYPIAGYGKQLAWNITTNTAFHRVQQSGAWSAWTQQASGGDNTDITSLNNVTLDGTTNVTGNMNDVAVAVVIAPTMNIATAGGNIITATTGTGPVTAFGTAQSGACRQIRFTASATLTHNATSLILPGGANIAAVSGDVAEFRSLGSGNWICTNFMRGTGQPVAVVSVAQGGTGVTTSTGSGSVVKADSPTLTGNPTAPTPATTSNATTLATTAFVHALAASYGLDGSSRNTANAGVTTSLDDLTTNGLYYNTNVLDAGPSKPPGSSTTGYILVINHSTASSPYVMQTWVPSVNADQSMSIRRNVNGVWDAWRTLAFTDSPALTGVPTAPTAAGGTNTTQLATTAFVTAADNLKANLTSPTFTGTPLAPTASAGTNTTQIATTAFVTAADNLKANLASPTFTGTPLAPTATAGTNTTQIATTAFVAASFATKASPTFTGTVNAATIVASGNVTGLGLVAGAGGVNNSGTLVNTGNINGQANVSSFNNTMILADGSLSVLPPAKNNANSGSIGFFAADGTTLRGAVYVSPANNVVLQAGNSVAALTCGLTASTFAHRVNGVDVVMSGRVYTGSGNSYLETDGNVVGSVWPGTNVLSSYLVNTFLTPAGLPSALTALTGGAIGSYSLLLNKSASGQSINTTLSGGANLGYSDTGNSDYGAPPGTWRLMSACNPSKATVMLRIA